ncbi:MAG: isoamylase early set domain-containing protein [Nitrospirae bacterium]|nr:isoamylase early set domain-containing protein [Nitrospirota bacterium]
MDKNMELIHKLLDGEVSEEEKKEILDRIDSDPVLKMELDALSMAVHIVEKSERLSVPPSFTSKVMGKLPVRKSSYREKVWDFFFKDRVLRWNMVTAAATVCLVIIVFTGVFQFQKKHSLISHTNISEGSTVTVKFNIYVPDAKEVAIAGDFNKWKVDGKNMMKKQDNGIWTIEIPLKPGAYNYMFVMDGKVWLSDPNAESYQDDGFGYKNSVLKVTKL